jgi:hypothetical protein
MTSTSWSRGPAARTAWAMAACVTLMACSSGGSSPSAHHSNTRPSASATAEPTSGPAAVAAVKATWTTFFNGAVPIPKRLTLLQDSSQFVSFVHAQEKTSIGALVLQATAKVASVKLGPARQATVIFTVLLNGSPLAKNLTGMAVYQDGTWKIAASSFCSLLRLAYGKKSHKLPAACGS